MKEEEIFKTCLTHGELLRPDVVKSGRNKSGTYRFKCKRCLQALHKAHYQKNKEKILLDNKIYREENHEKVKQIKAECLKKNKEKYRPRKLLTDAAYRERNREKLRKKHREQVANLYDYYVKKVICRNSYLGHKDIPQELIELKRTSMKLTRDITSHMENKNEQD